MGARLLRVTVVALVARAMMRLATRGGGTGVRHPSGPPVACAAFGARTCAVGEKGVMAGMVNGSTALALATPTMRGLT